MQQGDAPYFKSLADNYAMSDNFHQSVNGGTGANHIMLGHGDAIWFSDGNGNPRAPPHNVEVATRARADAGVVDEVENPESRSRAPTTGTREDGYGGGSDSARAVLSAAAPTATAPTRASPASAPIVDYLQSLPHRSTRAASRATTTC